MRAMMETVARILGFSEVAPGGHYSNKPDADDRPGR